MSLGAASATFCQLDVAEVANEHLDHLTLRGALRLGHGADPRRRHPPSAHLRGSGATSSATTPRTALPTCRRGQRNLMLKKLRSVGTLGANATMGTRRDVHE